MTLDAEVFVVLADTHVTGNLSNIVNYINEEVKPRFVIINGDISINGTLEELSQAKREFDRLACPYYAAIGNHDRASGSDENFRQVFGEPVYNFDVEIDGQINHFTVLDSAPGSISGEQMVWLEQDLNAANGKSKFVFIHHLVRFGGPVSEEWYWLSNRDQLASIFSRYNVSAVFQGHRHFDDWMQSDGVWYITSDSTWYSIGNPPPDFYVVRIFNGYVHLDQVYLPSFTKQDDLLVFRMAPLPLPLPLWLIGLTPLVVVGGIITFQEFTKM